MFIQYDLCANFFENYPDNYLSEINGNITDIDDATNQEVQIGKIRAYRVNWLAKLACRELHIIDVVDLQQDVCNLTAEITNDFKGFKSRMWTKLLWSTPPYPCNFLIIDAVLISHAYAGRNLGLAAIHRTLQQFGSGCEFAALSVRPLQFHPEFEFIPPKEKLDHLTNDEHKAKGKLKQHYAKLGFKSLDKTDIMLLRLFPKFPTLKQLRCNVVL